MRKIFRFWDKIDKKYTSGFSGYLTTVGELTTTKDHQIEQWIGIKDKLGHPVFENDILELKLEGQEPLRVKVVWDNEIPGFLFKNGKNNIIMLYSKDVPKMWEVVGNTNENLDLLF